MLSKEQSVLVYNFIRLKRSDLKDTFSYILKNELSAYLTLQNDLSS